MAARSVLALLVVLLVSPTAGESAQEQKYVISVGTPSERLPAGTLWLYSYSWYGLLQYRLAAIQDGLAVVSLDVDRLRGEADPHPNTDGYVIVVQAGEHLWFRTPDIAPDKLWTDLPGAIRSLGRSTDLPSGETQLLLPPPARRRLTFLDPDGRPRANLELQASIYLWDRNHCGSHTGLPLGNFRTDASGTIEIVSPLVPLFFDGLRYFDIAGSGPVGTAYSANVGWKTSAEEAVVIKVAWDIPSFDLHLRVLTLAGRPRKGVWLYGNWNTNTCGGAGQIAETDGSGTIRVRLNATFHSLMLRRDGPHGRDDPEGDKNTRDLSVGELHELFVNRKLTIRW